MISLPGTPYVAVQDRAGRLYLVLETMLVEWTADRRLVTMTSSAPWKGQFPNSAVLSRDEKKLFVGRCQFVAEFEIPTYRLRLLVPNKAFLNRLPAESEARLRMTHGGR